MADIKFNDAQVSRSVIYPADSDDLSADAPSPADAAPDKTLSQDAVLRQYQQQLTQQQGQLPGELAQKQQLLLRQLIELLDPNKARSSADQTSPQAAGSANSPLQQLLLRILPLLPAGDPLLDQPVLRQGEQQLPLRQLITNPALLTTLLQQLPSALKEHTPQGQALMQWLVQSISVRIPANQVTRNLASQLALQHISQLPDKPDKRLQQTLEQLGRATLQFILQSQATGLSRSGKEISAGVLNSSATRPNPQEPSSGVVKSSPQDKAPSNPGAPETGHKLDSEQADDGSTHETDHEIAALKSAAIASKGIHSASPSPTDGHSIKSVLKKETVQNEVGSMPAEGDAALPTSRNKSTVTTPVETQNERPALLQRISSLLRPSGPAIANMEHVDTASMMPNQPARMSFGAFVFELGQQLTSGQLPELLRPSLKKLHEALQQPLKQSDDVEQWFEFLMRPLSSSSSSSRALQQWAFTLLTIRLQQLASEQDERKSQQPDPAQSQHDDEKQTTQKLAAAFSGQLERFKQLHQELQQPLPTYVPLPPQQPGGRESGLSLKRSPGKCSAYQWTLSFIIEPPQLGPIQIRACLDIPDIQLQATAERLSSVDKLRETLPLLEGRFRELGLVPGNFLCRQGKVTFPSDEDDSSREQPNSGLSIRI